MREYPQSPIPSVGAVVINNKKILMIKRGKPPAEGIWSIPGGRLKLGESLQQAAEREVFEETGLVIKSKYPIYTFDFIEKDQFGKVKFHYVIVDLLAEYISGEPVPGDDASEACWFDIQEIEKLPVGNTSRILAEKIMNDIQDC